MNEAPPSPLSPNHARIAEANRLYYARTAAIYDATETCVVDPRAQAEMRADVESILSLLGRPPETLRALDACAGSGNLTHKLLASGLNVTAVDVASELLDRLRARCRAEVARLEVHHAEVADFLAQSQSSFDLVCFSSALHHLEDVTGVLALAVKHLTPGGLLYTTFDPTSVSDQGRLARWIQRFDYLGFKVLDQRADLPAALHRRLRRMLAGTSKGDKSGLELGDQNLGVLAEYHVDTGLDDHRLVRELIASGMEVVWHERLSRGRSRWTERALRALGECNSFKLLLRSPASRPGG